MEAISLLNRATERPRKNARVVSGGLKIDILISDGAAEVRCTVRTVAQTGVEMEALTGVAVALLTIYDMCKAVDKEMRITDIRLLEKTKHGIGVRE